MVKLSETMLMPNVNGGPKNCMACKETSVNIMICCFVSIAAIISDPDPILRSPAVFTALADHVIRLS